MAKPAEPLWLGWFLLFQEGENRRREDEMDGGHYGWVRDLGNLVSLLLYFLPTLVGWLRSRSHAAGPAVPVGLLFVLNLLLGWTIFGWIAVLVLACRDPHAVAGAGGGDSGGGGGGGGVPLGWQPSGHAPVWETPPDPMTGGIPEPCLRCGDRGEVCPRCHGSQGVWELPTGDSGTSAWVPCTYCLGSGRVQCGLCGRSG